MLWLALGTKNIWLESGEHHGTAKNTSIGRHDHGSRSRKK